MARYGQSCSTVLGLRLISFTLRPLKAKVNVNCISTLSPYRAVNTPSVIKPSQLRLYREIIAVCSQIHTKHINTLCGQNAELYINTQSVPRSKHSVSVIQTSQLMLYREIIAVCSQIHAKHTNTAVWAERRIVEC